MKLKLSILPACLVVFALLTQTACNSSSVISNLNRVVSAADTAFKKFRQINDFDPVVTAKIQAYLDAVVVAGAASATELASTDTNAEKARRIVEIWALAVVPQIKGLPPVVASLITAVDIAVQIFLEDFHPMMQARVMSGGVGKSVMKPSMMERHELASIESRCTKLQEKLRNMSMEPK